MIAASDEHAVRVGVVGEVVPSAFAAELHTVGKFEGLLCRSGNHRDGEERNDKGKNSLHDFSLLC